MTLGNSLSANEFAARLRARKQAKLAEYEAEDSGLEAEGLSDEDKAHAQEQAGRTTITRKSLSAPLKYLESKGVFSKLRSNARVLDYGAGLGVDVDLLREKFPKLTVKGYDYHPKRDEFKSPPRGKFDLIYCNYVLNVISDRGIRTKVIDSIANLLKPSGVAYISVRADVANLKGMTSKGTWQGLIKLLLPMEKHKSGSFTTYRMTLDDLEKLKSLKKEAPAKEVPAKGASVKRASRRKVSMGIAQAIKLFREMPSKLLEPREIQILVDKLEEVGQPANLVELKRFYQLVIDTANAVLEVPQLKNLMFKKDVTLKPSTKVEYLDAHLLTLNDLLALKQMAVKADPTHLSEDAQSKLDAFVRNFNKIKKLQEDVYAPVLDGVVQKMRQNTEELKNKR